MVIGISLRYVTELGTGRRNHLRLDEGVMKSRTRRVIRFDIGRLGSESEMIETMPADSPSIW